MKGLIANTFLQLVIVNTFCGKVDIITPKCTLLNMLFHRISNLHFSSYEKNFSMSCPTSEDNVMSWNAAHEIC